MERISDDKYDVTYKKMYALYNLLLKGEHEYPARSYFKEIVQLYEDGDRMTKIRGIEIILRILQGRVIKNRQEDDEEENYKGMGIVQYRLRQIKARMLGILSREETPAPQRVYSNDDLLQWIEEILTNERDEKILTTYFIFIKSNWDHFSNSELATHVKMIQLHYKFVKENKSYQKLASFDRLYFS